MPWRVSISICHIAHSNISGFHSSIHTIFPMLHWCRYLNTNATVLKSCYYGVHCYSPGYRDVNKIWVIIVSSYASNLRETHEFALQQRHLTTTTCGHSINDARDSIAIHGMFVCSKFIFIIGRNFGSKQSLGNQLNSGHPPSVYWDSRLTCDTLYTRVNSTLSSHKCEDKCAMSIHSE